MNWIVYSILTAILWGFFYICIEQIVKNIDKSTYISASCVINFLVFLILARNNVVKDLSYIQENPKIGIWMALAMLALIFGNYLSLLAVETSNATLAASLEITYPFWCILFAALLFGTSVSYISMMGIFVVFLGVLIILYGKQ